MPSVRDFTQKNALTPLLRREVRREQQSVEPLSESSQVDRMILILCVEKGVMLKLRGGGESLQMGQ